MRKIIYSVLLSGLCFAIAGCKKETTFYSGEEGIYFAVQRGAVHGSEAVWAFQRNTPVEFVKLKGAIDTLRLRVMITGAVKDYDRPFTVIANPDSTTAVAGINYEPLKPEYVIKAGSIDTRIEIIVKRTADIQQQFKLLGLKLIPGKHFTLSINEWRQIPPYWAPDIKGNFNPSLHQIQISDFLTKPARWIGQANSGIEAGLWGDFTKKKYLLICEKFDLIYEDFATAETMPDPKRTNIQEIMARYLQDLYTKGTPVLEDDGRLMYFSGVSWTSKIGVPWVP